MDAGNAVTPEEMALLIVHRDGFLNTSHASGSVLGGGGRAWRYLEGHLTEVPWIEYEKALSCRNRKDWPPYTIGFEIAPLSADGTVTVDVSMEYDGGITEDSRGGNSTTWTLRCRDGNWEVDAVDYTMYWD